MFLSLSSFCYNIFTMSTNINKKMIGLPTLLAMVLGSMIGTGALLTPTLMVQYGKYGYIAWPISAIMCLGLALMFSNMASKMVAHGPAGFVHKIFGQLASFQVSWAQWVALVCAQGVIAFSFGQYLAPVVGQEYSLVISLTGIWLVTILSMFMTVLSLTGILVLTIIKVGVLLLVSFSGFGYLSVAKISSLPAMGGLSGFEALIGAVSFSLLSYIGLEFGTIPGENVRNPRVNIPLATIIGTIIAGVIYTLSYAVVGSALSPEFLQTTNRPVYDAIVLFLGEWGGKALIFGSGLGFFASLNGILFAKSYILKHTAEVGATPKIFGNVTKSANFPHIAALLSSVCSTAVLLAVYFEYTSVGVVGGLSVALSALVYLWSAAAFRYMSSNTILWLVNIFTCFLFLSGVLFSGKAALITLIYLMSFFVYGLFHKNKYISTVV